MSPGLVRTAMTADVPAFADIPDDQWTDIGYAADLMVEAAAGRLDAVGSVAIEANGSFSLRPHRPVW